MPSLEGDVPSHFLEALSRAEVRLSLGHLGNHFLLQTDFFHQKLIERRGSIASSITKQSRVSRILGKSIHFEYQQESTFNFLILL